MKYWELNPDWPRARQVPSHLNYISGLHFSFSFLPSPTLSHIPDIFDLLLCVLYLKPLYFSLTPSLPIVPLPKSNGHFPQSHGAQPPATLLISPECDLNYWRRNSGKQTLRLIFLPALFVWIPSLISYLIMQYLRNTETSAILFLSVFERQRFQCLKWLQRLVYSWD